jgi:hypothetical protein
MQDELPRLGDPAFLAIWNDFDRGRDDEYNRWHTFEHVPERLRVEGIVGGVRYWAPEREELRYFTLYELENIAVLGGAGYTRLVRRPSEWSSRLRPSFRNFVRYPCSTIASLGVGRAGAVLTARFGTAHEIEPIQATPVLQGFLESHGITRLRLGEADTSAPFPIPAADSGPAGAHRYVLIAEGLERAALERRMPRIVEALRQDFEAEGEVACETYLLAFALER